SPRASLLFYCTRVHLELPSFPTRRSSDLADVLRLVRVGRHLGQPHRRARDQPEQVERRLRAQGAVPRPADEVDERQQADERLPRSEEHTSELQSRENLVCRLLLEKKKKQD